MPWTLVQGTIHTRTLKNKLPFPVHVAGVLDQNRPGRAFLRPTLSGDVSSLSLDYGKKRLNLGPPDHRRDSVPRYLETYPGGFQIGASTSEMAVLGHIRPRFSSVSTLQCVFIHIPPS